MNVALAIFHTFASRNYGGDRKHVLLEKNHLDGFVSFYKEEDLAAFNKVHPATVENLYLSTETRFYSTSRRPHVGLARLTDRVAVLPRPVFAGRPSSASTHRMPVGDRCWIAPAPPVSLVYQLRGVRMQQTATLSASPP